MRLTALQTNLNLTSTNIERQNFIEQMTYNESCMALAEGKSSSHCIIHNENATKHQYTVALRGVKYFTDDYNKEAIDWLYPGGVDSDINENSTGCCILAATNESGDMWNTTIQNMRIGEPKLFSSHDYLCEVDDAKKHLSDIMTEELMNSIKASGIPNHTLKLKVGDVCLVLRPLIPIGLATNQRVKILKFFDKTIKVQTIENDPKIVFIPKIKFKFSMRLGDSYKMIRVQFPLRLAYCMTYNKSQGQTLEKVLLDITEEPFAHGHSYVSLSRVRKSDDIRIYCKKDMVIDINDEKVPIITNIVYKNVLLTNELECCLVDIDSDLHVYNDAMDFVENLEFEE
jgi:hypothetical protein